MQAGLAAGADRIAAKLGRGLVAGAAATAAMTVSSTLEMKLRGRPPSDAPAQVAAKLLDVEPDGGPTGRFATGAHLTAGVTIGATRGLLDATPIGDRAAAAIFLLVAWSPDLIAVPAADAAPPPWRWGLDEVALSALHHVVYAAAGEGAYRALRNSG